MGLTPEKVDFLGKIEEPDNTIKLIDTINDPEKEKAFEQQEISNRKIYLQRELRELYDKGIIDKDCNYLIK